MGTDSAARLEGQTSKLKKANSNLSLIEKSAIPGADKLIALIGKNQKKNQIILAFVISICLACILNSLGFIAFLRGIVNGVSTVSKKIISEEQPY